MIYLIGESTYYKRVLVYTYTHWHTYIRVWSHINTKRRMQTKAAYSYLATQHPLLFFDEMYIC